ncbi:MAG: hypothetical protein ABI867_06240 [Kofleriaceae bacterium]
MLEPLGAAIDDAAWETALAIALDWWRETRAVELADLIDALGARCGPQLASEDLHAWWIEHAIPYAPAAITALASSASTGAWNSDRAWPDLLARYPDDPLLVELAPAIAELKALDAASESCRATRGDRNVAR